MQTDPDDSFSLTLGPPVQSQRHMASRSQSEWSALLATSAAAQLGSCWAGEIVCATIFPSVSLCHALVLMSEWRRLTVWPPDAHWCLSGFIACFAYPAAYCIYGLAHSANATSSSFPSPDFFTTSTSKKETFTECSFTWTRTNLMSLSPVSFLDFSLTFSHENHLFLLRLFKGQKLRRLFKLL